MLKYCCVVDPRFTPLTLLLELSSPDLVLAQLLFHLEILIIYYFLLMLLVVLMIYNV